MSLDPADLIGGLASTADVSKQDLSAYEKSRNIARFSSVNEVNNTDLSARYVIFVGSYIYLNTGDRISADNGSSILVSLDGTRWTRVANAPTNWRGNWNVLTTYQIGDGVTYNNSSFVGITADNLANIPAVGSANWQVNALAGSPGGPVSISYTFDTTTADADPGNGKLRLSSATQNIATVIRADLLDNLGSTWTGVLDTFDASTSTIKGFIQLQHQFDESKWLFFTVSARAAPSGYRNITVACVGYSAANPFANGDPLLLEFVRTGDKGDTGATGAGFAATSTTSLATGTGSKAFTTQAGLAYSTGARIRATSAGTPADYMEGVVASYSGTTLTVTMDRNVGTGTHADWNINTVGDLGAVGNTGAAGTSALTICRAVATTNFTVASAIVNGATMDGVTLATGDRVLLTGQTTAAENGVYIVAASGAASRDASFATYDSHPGVFFSVMEGTSKHDTLWQCTSDRGGTIGSTSLVIAAFSSGGGGSADGFGRARCVSQTNVTIASGLVNGASVGGVTLATGDSVLLTGQSAPAENGLYTAVASGAAARHTSFATFASLPGTFFSVSEGTNGDTLWQVTTDAGGTIGVTAIAISQFMSATDDWGLVTGALTTSDDWGSV